MTEITKNGFQRINSRHIVLEDLKMRIGKLCVWFAILSLLSKSSFGAFEWINTTSGYWNDPLNWQAADSTNKVPDGTDEIKIRQGRETILNTVEDNDSARLRLYVGTMTIHSGANLTIGWTRIGHTNAQTAVINQDGGTFDHQDGRLSLGNDYATGIWNISGGTLSSTGSGMYIGYTRGSGLAPSTGRLVAIGSNAAITVDDMYVGVGTVASGDTGILEFQMDAGGASTMVITNRLELDVSDADSIARLEVSASATLAKTDIVLVNVTSATAIAGAGAFDSMNGGPAAEGTIILVGGNLYSLTYQYDADGDSANNDVALVFVAGEDELAHDPNPANGISVETSLSTLSWTNPEPNTPGAPITCDVYFGVDPNRPDMDKVTLGADISSVEINATNFPHHTPLTNNTWYYWVVDCHDPSGGGLIEGLMWSFYTDDNEPPTADAGPDQVVWLGKSGTPNQEMIQLDGTASSDDGKPNPLTYLWEQVPNDAPEVTVTPDNIANPTVTVTERGVYEFSLTVDDGGKQNSDTVQISVGTDACDASHLSTGDPYNEWDQNMDCLVDLKDFASFALNWLDCTDTLTYCGI